MPNLRFPNADSLRDLQVNTCAVMSPDASAEGPFASPRQDHAIVVVTQGKAHFRTFMRRQSHTLTLTVGQAIYRPPGAWLLPEPTRSYKSIGCVFGGSTSILLRSRAVRPRTGQWQLRKVRQVVSRPATAQTMLLAQALLLSDPANASSVAHCRTFEALAAGLAELFEPGVNAAPAPVSRARLTFDAAAQLVHSELRDIRDRSDVAEALRISPEHLSRLFTRFAGQSFNAYLNQARLAHARALLASPELSVQEVANLCGYQSGNYFGRQFRQAQGMTPTAFARQVREQSP